MTVHRYLVTASLDDRMSIWAATAARCNWIDGKENGPERETWLVTAYDKDAELIKTACQAQPETTLQEIEYAGDTEEYVLVCGDPDRGWKP
jgi:hypothetical protein